jgi:hypothetical protein
LVADQSGGYRRAPDCRQAIEASSELVMRIGSVCCVALVALLVSCGAPPMQQIVPTQATGMVIVEWTTESEFNLAGFNVYRSERPEGSFLRLNGALIPASSDPVARGSYVYTDTAVTAGVTYYYKLEDVELDGNSTMHGPIELAAAADTIFHFDITKSVALAMLVGLLLTAGFMAMGIGKRAS